MAQIRKVISLVAPYATKLEEFESDLRQALALDPSNADAHAGLVLLLALEGHWAELSAEIDIAVRDNPTNNLLLLAAAAQLPYLGRPEEGVAMADLALRLDPQTPVSRRGLVIPPTFSAASSNVLSRSSIKFQTTTATNSTRFFRAASYAFLDRAEDAERAKADLIAKNGEQVMEIWFNEGEVFARTNEQDIEREGFRKLGLRICATEEELKKFDNPKRLPECVKT